MKWPTDFSSSTIVCSHLSVLKKKKKSHQLLIALIPKYTVVIVSVVHHTDCYVYFHNSGIHVVIIIINIIIINIIINIIIYPLTARVVEAPQRISQPVSSIFPCSPLPSGT